MSGGCSDHAAVLCALLVLVVASYGVCLAFG